MWRQHTHEAAHELWQLVPANMILLPCMPVQPQQLELELALELVLALELEALVGQPCTSGQSHGHMLVVAS